MSRETVIEAPVPPIEHDDGVPTMDMGGVRLSYDPRYAKVVLEFTHPEAMGRASFTVKAFDMFLRAASAYNDGLSGTREIVKDSQENAEIPEHEEGPCKNCHSSQILADGVMRKCKGCDYVWRVPIPPPPPPTLPVCENCGATACRC